ncbi:MAG: hypothetical protein EOO15_11840 [Chitinophagaceae bacterium]|nr:MAG: hypothetical protein EOO15_11840 [Chitinophagaceae bacterium]
MALPVRYNRSQRFATRFIEAAVALSPRPGNPWEKHQNFLLFFPSSSLCPQGASRYRGLRDVRIR